VPAVSFSAWLEQNVDCTNTLPDVSFLVVKFQSGKMVTLMITPMFVCLYDQQEPSLCVLSCASLPICIAPNYYISYVVMFCKKSEPTVFALFQYLQKTS
jgi:hypothetical protein